MASICSFFSRRVLLEAIQFVVDMHTCAVLGRPGMLRCWAVG